nr:class II aldolase/adducin family protein [Blautia sp. MSJ-19]
MSDTLEKKLEQAVWIAHSLFERGKTAGSTANMSFRHEDKIYITASGTCFGTLKKEDFAVIDLNGEVQGDKKPSKEFPLHLSLYQAKEQTGAVIHTHSFYSTIWSCLAHENERDCIPSYTPYLKMKLGTVGLIPYAKPGTEELFKAFRERIKDSDGYLLRNHGPVAGGKNLMDAFYILEELEESAKVAWTLKDCDVQTIQ